MFGAAPGMVESSERPSLNLDLSELATGFPHVPPECGAALTQAAVVCLKHLGHSSGVRLQVDDPFLRRAGLEWSLVLTEAMRRYWNDLEEAVEQGAYGLAILLMRHLTGYTVIERSRKGTGFDWWLGAEDDLFQAKARLEVSGILRGSARRIRSRVSAKKKQTKSSEQLLLPAYIVVVEFGTPRARVDQP
jgi:hypothetical protein